jgi:cytochrome c5
MSDKQEDFTRVFIWVLAGLVLFTIVVMLVARSVGMDENSGPMTDTDIDERTKPYSTVKVAGDGAPEAASTEAAPAAQPATLPEPAPAESAATEQVAEAIDGKSLYSACAACHATGAAGAPVVGDAAAWGPRLAGGIDMVVNNAINGKGAMPPKGGSMHLSDDEIRAIVEYMVDSSQ